jgi:hypothetical protein
MFQRRREVLKEVLLKIQSFLDVKLCRYINRSLFLKDRGYFTFRV